MKTFKTMGLEYYVTDCDNIQQAVETFIKNKIGVTTKDIYEWDQVIPQGATIFTYITKSNRELALEWWSKVPNKPEIADKYHLGHITIQEWQIEEIWENETQQNDPVLESINLDEWDDGSDPKPQVDFEMLKDSIPMIEACVHHCQPLWNNKVENLKLFFQLLSEKQSFAVLAHKTLKNLKK